MLATLKKLFGLGPSVDFKNLVANGALIVDVRTSSEFKSGHIKGALNIPVNSLGSNLKKLPKNKTIITCCASGMRSASAKSVLKSNGYDVHNGGSWYSLQNKIS